MNSVIEDSRQSYEDVDQFERSLASLLLSLDAPGLTHRDKLSTAHRAQDLISRIVQRSQLLLETNDVETVQFQERNVEMEEITAKGLQEFYRRLAKVKDYHRKYPDLASNSASNEISFAALEQGDEEWLDHKFTGEEGLGRYMDLHSLHDSFNNLGPIKQTYLQFLAKLTTFNLDLNLKYQPQYATYLTQLLNYLSTFYEKVFPLGDLDALLKIADQEFATKWEKDLIPGWTDSEPTTLTEKSTWCAFCQKSYSKQTVFTAHLTSKKHLKLSSAESAAPTTEIPTLLTPTEQKRNKSRALALKEALIISLVGTSTPAPTPLSQILLDTLSNTERRAALTDRERATEIEELEAREIAEAAAAATTSLKARQAEEEEDEDGEGRIYNPLKLPLGWDGKPIPFWLYKLHGLGVEFKCEICSDFIYMGRKTFERHFQESRHAFGMRALGLPNTKHFHEIVRIEDAIALAEKLKMEGKQDVAQVEMMEELEDDDGNVYNRKTYEDLKRQGLL